MVTVRLTSSMLDRVFGGVCGGIGKYLGIDGWWVRAAFIALTIAASIFAILLYVLLWLMIPPQRLSELPPVFGTGDNGSRYARPETVLLLGAGAMIVGVIVLARSSGVLEGLNGDLLAPAMLLGIGIVVLLKQISGVA